MKTRAGCREIEMSDENTSSHNRKLELDIPGRALRWLEKRLAEKPDKKYV
jgi:hypothetical protein